jgi:hypothetical protein
MKKLLRNRERKRKSRYEAGKGRRRKRPFEWKEFMDSWGRKVFSLSSEKGGKSKEGKGKLGIDVRNYIKWIILGAEEYSDDSIE